MMIIVRSSLYAAGLVAAVQFTMMLPRDMLSRTFDTLVCTRFFGRRLSGLTELAFRLHVLKMAGSCLANILQPKVKTKMRCVEMRAH